MMTRLTRALWLRLGTSICDFVFRRVSGMALRRQTNRAWGKGLSLGILLASGQYEYHGGHWWWSTTKTLV